MNFHMPRLDSKRNSRSIQETQSIQRLSRMNSVVNPTESVTSVSQFLQVRWGIDFIQDRMITSSAKPPLYACIPTDNSLKQRAEGIELVVKQFRETSGEAPSDVEIQDFYKELGLIWFFKDHSNFVSLYGFSMFPMSFILKYYAMGDLGMLIAGSSRANHRFRYTMQLVIDMLKQLTEAVQYMHGKGVVHGDLMSSHILLDVDEFDHLHPVLTGFAKARQVESISSLSRRESYQSVGTLQSLKFLRRFSIHSNAQGHAGNTTGNTAIITYKSPEWIAPELLLQANRREKVSTDLDGNGWSRTDVFSIAVIMIHLMTRHQPWK